REEHVVGGDRDVARAGESVAPARTVTGDLADDRLGAVEHLLEDRDEGVARLLRRPALEVGTRAECVAFVRQYDEPDGVIGDRLFEVVAERVQQLDGHRVAVVRPVQRDRRDAVIDGVKGCVVHENWPGLRPEPGGPAKACAIVSHSSATSPVAWSVVSSRWRLRVTTSAKSSALPRTTFGASSGP